MSRHFSETFVKIIYFVSGRERGREGERTTKTAVMFPCLLASLGSWLTLMIGMIGICIICVCLWLIIIQLENWWQIQKFPSISSHVIVILNSESNLWGKLEVAAVQEERRELIKHGLSCEAPMENKKNTNTERDGGFTGLISYKILYFLLHILMEVFRIFKSLSV